jgi:hypothetical protein
VSRRIYYTAVAVFFVAFLAMGSITVAWMFVPTHIIYRQSSLQPTPPYSVEVRQHGHSYFLTPTQKALVDTIYYLTPRVWFGSLGVIIVAILVGAAARLRMPSTD